MPVHSIRSGFVNIQHPIKMYGLKDETLAFRTKTTHFYGAGKARSASDRPHEQAVRRLRMRVLNSYQDFIMEASND